MLKHENPDTERSLCGLLAKIKSLLSRFATPLSRASLLEAKALPPLIRLRRKLEAATAAVGVADSSSALSVEPEPERARRTCADSNPAAAAAAGKGGVGLEGAGWRDRAASSRPSRERDDAERVDGDGEQPPLEAMVGLIVDEMVGRTSSSTARKAPVGR